MTVVANRQQFLAGDASTVLTLVLIVSTCPPISLAKPVTLLLTVSNI
jgi:hypothetical protein